MANPPRKPNEISVSESNQVANEQQTASSRGLSASFAVQMSRFSGPIPSPEVLAKYEEVIYGLADKLIDRFEKQSDHRMELEKKVTDADILQSRMGLIFGAVIAMSFLWCSYHLVMSGHDVAGGTLGASSIGGIITTFVVGSKKRQVERETKMNALIEPDPPNQIAKR